MGYTSLSGVTRPSRRVNRHFALRNMGLQCKTLLNSACQVLCSASSASCSGPIEPEPLHRPDGSIRSRRPVRYSNVFGLDRRKRDCRRAGRALTLGNGFPGRAVRRRLHFVCTRVWTGRRQWRRLRCSGTCCRRCARAGPAGRQQAVAPDVPVQEKRPAPLSGAGLQIAAMTRART
jgi:hypothetical protein